MNPASRRQSRTAILWLIGSAALLVVGVSFLLLEERADAFLGIETGGYAASAVICGVIACIATGAYTLSLMRLGHASTMTLGEKTALVSLICTGLIAAYLFSKLQLLGWDSGPGDPVLARVVGMIIVIAIAEAIAISILRKREMSEPFEDERDASIRQRAASGAHMVLVVLIVAFVVQIGFGAHWVGLTTPAAIAHALIALLILSELTRHGTEVWLYSRDRV